MEDREHLTRKFRDKYIDKILIELKEFELLGWKYEVLGAGTSAVLGIYRHNSCFCRYVVYVNRERDRLGWSMEKRVDGTLTAVLTMRTFDFVWYFIKREILSDARDMG